MSESERRLLADVNAINKKYELIRKKTGGNFNIFSIADIQDDEVKVCRIIHALISPDGPHNQGIIYLRLFVKHVLGLENEFSDDELKKANVYREYRISGDRRIDLVIETPKKFIPIEVKIYAKDQTAQCYDYYKAAEEISKKLNKNKEVKTKVYYLTRFGDSPENYSTCVDKGEDISIECRSFKINILEWLEACLKLNETIRIASIREIIIQFMSTIRMFTGEMEDEEMKETVELVESSIDSIKSAYNISEALTKAKTNKMRDLFDGIEKELGETVIRSNKDCRCIDEDKNHDKINSFYGKRKEYPGISYLYKENLNNSENKGEQIDLWVRIEIDWQLYVGYCFTKNGNLLETKGNDELVQLIEDNKNIFKFGIDEKAMSKNTWWAYWDYIKIDGKKIDFINNSGDGGAYFLLYDDNKFKEIVDICVKRIKELLE